MKAIFLYILLIASTATFAQTTEPVTSASPSEGKAFLVVEQMPEYPGGDEALKKFIRDNLRYPKMESTNGIQGRVIIAFVVEIDGSLSNITLKNTISAGIDEEAKRIVSTFPKFKPGKQQGQLVRVEYIIPIYFKLD